MPAARCLPVLSMAQLSWYWHRLRAMSLAEVVRHAGRFCLRWADAWHQPDWTSVRLGANGGFPWLPDPTQAPPAVRQALQQDAEAILAGRWKAFGHLQLHVHNPPRWQRDYLAGRDVSTTAPAARLSPRALPAGTDIKLIWELSRWYPLVRLAMASYLLGHRTAAHTCVAWLQDWAARNPPFRGWNWTSALEAGLRLIQLSWIDALLSHSHGERDGSGAHGDDAVLAQLRQAILPPHVWFTWRHRSFGSSANNHLLGELAGLIVALSRWPDLAHWAAPLAHVQALWEQEVLAQFAADGGNCEQALNYHLFAWELCWQARAALAAAGRAVSTEVDERLRRAAQFYLQVQVPTDPWDYGDSDTGWVTPLFADDARAVAEWCDWLAGAQASSALAYWWGPTQKRLGLRWPQPPNPPGGWQVLSPSGYGLWREGRWTLRYDFSPLGYLSTAAHGHADALHMSLWLDGMAIVVDPGTGCYLAELGLRTWLASAAAHNGPYSPALATPRRLGPFLWSGHPAPPAIQQIDRRQLRARDARPEAERIRTVQVSADGAVVEVQDVCRLTARHAGPASWTVRWQFAPDTALEQLGPHRFGVQRQGKTLVVEMSPAWTEVCAVSDPAQARTIDPDKPYAGWVSPGFRQTVWAPYLKLVWHGESGGAGAQAGCGGPCALTTRFIALEAA